MLLGWSCPLTNQVNSIVFHESKEFLDFRQRKVQAIPQVALIIRSQIPNRNLTLNFRPRAKWGLLRSFRKLQAAIWKPLTDQFCLNAPIPGRAKRGNFLADGKRTQGTFANAELLGPPLHMFLEISEFQRSDGKSVA